MTGFETGSSYTLAISNFRIFPFTQLYQTNDLYYLIGNMTIQTRLYEIGMKPVYKVQDKKGNLISEWTHM